MRITESRLRRLIRQVINESVDTRQLSDKKEFYQYLMAGISKAFPVIIDEDKFDNQTYSFSDRGYDGFGMTVNNKAINQKDFGDFLEELYYEHTRTGEWMPLDICVKRMIGFLESEGLMTKTTYKARGGNDLEYADLSPAELDAKKASFAKSFFG